VNTPLHFELLATDGAARRGRVTLNHGIVETPIFMPVGTYGSVKAIGPDELRRMTRRLFWATPFIYGCAQGLT
jgi:queuine tRNA-ribosyltransferase